MKQSREMQELKGKNIKRHTLTTEVLTRKYQPYENLHNSKCLKVITMLTPVWVCNPFTALPDYRSVDGVSGGATFTSGLPMRFHEIHADNVRLVCGSTVARRMDNLHNSFVFSSRPVQVNEQVVFRLTKCSNRWNGALRLVHAPSLYVLPPDLPP